MIAASTLAAKETLQQLKSQKDVMKTTQKVSIISPRKKLNPPETGGFRMQILLPEKYYPLQIQSIVGNSPRSTMKRLEMGLDPNDPNTRIQSVILPKMSTEDRMNSSSSSKSRRPQSASITRPLSNSGLSTNNFFFLLPEDTTKTSTEKKNTHLKPFGPSSTGTNLAILKSPPPATPTKRKSSRPKTSNVHLDPRSNPTYTSTSEKKHPIVVVPQEINYY